MANWLKIIEELILNQGNFGPNWLQDRGLAHADAPTLTEALTANSWPRFWTPFGISFECPNLEALYKEYQSMGLEIIAFPCNQFGKQEPGDNAAIQEFCSLTFDVTFPVMAKVDVNGENTIPLYEYLKKAAPGVLGTQGIKWNFTKFLVSRDRKTIKRYAPKDKPEALKSDIENMLNM